MGDYDTPSTGPTARTQGPVPTLPGGGGGASGGGGSAGGSGGAGGGGGSGAQAAMVVDVLKELENIANVTLQETAVFCSSTTYLDRIDLLQPTHVAKVQSHTLLHPPTHPHTITHIHIDLTINHLPTTHTSRIWIALIYCNQHMWPRCNQTKYTCSQKHTYT